MKYVPLMWAGLWRKPLRTVLTTLALVFAFVLFGLLQGINAGFDAFRKAARADGLYVISRYGGPLPIAYKDQIADMPGVAMVSAVTFLGGTVNGEPTKQVGISFAQDGFFDFFRWLDITPQQIAELRQKRTAVAVGKPTADRVGLKIGDRFTLKSQVAMQDGSNDWPLEVTAIIDRKDIPDSADIVVGNFEFANEQKPAAAKDMVNQFMVLVNDPALGAGTARAIDELFLNSAAPTRTLVDEIAADQDFADDTTPVMVNSIVLSSLFALLLMTSSTMMQSFRERITEFGMMKAVGFDDGKVLTLVLAEACIQCLLGAAVGLAIARIIAPYVKSVLAGVSGVMTVSWWVVAVGLGVAGLLALISAAIPAWRAARMEIVDALAGDL